MSKFSKIFLRIFAGLCVCFFITIALFATGVIEAPVFLNIYQDKQYDDLNSSADNGKYYSDVSNGGGALNIAADPNKVPSALTITLKGDYLTAFKKATKTFGSKDTKSQILIKVGLQILQSKTIRYEKALHFYSLSYSNAGNAQFAKTYSLNNCINRINAGQIIYTDCFGFVRLAHSIACYTINSSNPEKVSGISGLYGWKGGYSEGKAIQSMRNIKSGAVIYDCLTGSGSGERHVAMDLYTNGTEVVYMDQGGIKTGKFQNGSFIYSAASSTPYKFNKFKNYC
jgi:hypothetical protein